MEGGDYAQSQQSGSRSSLVERRRRTYSRGAGREKAWGRGEVVYLGQGKKRGDVACIQYDAGSGPKRKLIPKELGKPMVPKSDKTSSTQCHCHFHSHFHSHFQRPVDRSRDKQLR